MSEESGIQVEIKSEKRTVEPQSSDIERLLDAFENAARKLDRHHIILLVSAAKRAVKSARYYDQAVLAEAILSIESEEADYA